MTASATYEDRSVESATASEAGKWNWGAFLLTWIWAFAHRAWLWGVLGLLPLVGLVVMFVLGAKGNEIALRNRRYESAGAFRQSQRRWAAAGVVLYALIVLLLVIGAIA